MSAVSLLSPQHDPVQLVMLGLTCLWSPQPEESAASRWDSRGPEQEGLLQTPSGVGGLALARDRVGGPLCKPSGAQGDCRVPTTKSIHRALPLASGFPYQGPGLGFT